MRRNILLLVLVVFTLSCRDAGIPVTPQSWHGVRIMLQNGFQSDSVTISVDSLIVAAFYPANTDQNNLAGGVGFGIAEGNHTLSINILTFQTRKDTIFTYSESNLFIGVNYVRTQNQITYTFTVEKPSNWPIW